MNDSSAPEQDSLTPRRARLFVVAIGAAVVVFDQITKIWAVAALETGPQPVVGDFLTFRLVRNPGAAFGSFTGAGPLLGIVAVVATVWVVVYAGRLVVNAGPRSGAADGGDAAISSRRLMWPLVGLGLIAGGAIGNVIDRLLRAPYWMRGEVIDFVELPRWPVFNVADSAVVVGVILVVASLAWATREPSRTERDAARDEEPTSR